MTTKTTPAQHLHELARLRRVRDRMDREYAEPLDVEALTFERVQASAAEIVQEPTEQPYGVATAPFATPRATCSASSSCAEPPARGVSHHDKEEKRFPKA